MTTLKGAHERFLQLALMEPMESDVRAQAQQQLIEHSSSNSNVNNNNYVIPMLVVVLACLFIIYSFVLDGHTHNISM